MKICVVTPRFAIAGVPLAQLRFTQALVNHGHTVDLIIGYVDPQYTLPDLQHVRLHVWDQPRVINMLFDLVRYLKSATPDIIFSAEDHLNTVVLLAAIIARSKAKISGSSRVTPFDTYSSSLFSKRWILKQLARSVMWRADALTCVSKDMVDQYRKVFRNPPHVCVYNIVDDRQSRLRLTERVEHRWLGNKNVPVLVAAGRLAEWKGFSDLINAFKILRQNRPVRLLILGDGPLKGELQAQIDNLGLTEEIELAGYVQNPLKYFKKADVFVLSSHVEGLPNVLVEAMMCGCTPVSTDCPTGPRELLDGGRYGYLVPMHDTAAMAAGIQKALDNPISADVLTQAIAPFEEHTVIKRHFEVLGLMDQDRCRVMP